MIVRPRRIVDFDTGLSPCGPGRLRIETYRAASERDETIVYA